MLNVQPVLLAAAALEGLQRHAANQAGPHDVPEWLHVCPPGPVVEGRDGRRYRVQDPQAAIEATEFPLHLDLDHRSFPGFLSEADTTAYAWVDRMEFVEEGDSSGREPGFWAHVESWTQTGEHLVANREFRFLSPVLLVGYANEEEQEAGLAPELFAFHSVALTNTPNLRLAALNAQQAPTAPRAQENRMDPVLIALAQRLGLAPNCSAAELARAMNARLDQVDELVPRADLEAALTRATNAEQAIEAHRREAHDAAVEAALNAAVKAGKIAPASLEFYRHSCKDAAGLERFSAEMAKRPSMVAGVWMGLGSGGPSLHRLNVGGEVAST